MTTDKQLIEKTCYETFMEGNPASESAQVLGEAYLEEQKKDISDLSAIRYAQGEVYFHYKDYESAIFKWENIRNEWEPWAKKNIADAYFEMGMLTNAEESYKSIVTESMTLNTEVSLQLFSLYIEQGRTELASTVIKETVAYNPDYPNVTRLARAFFEGNQDEASMVELAMNEAVRLESLEWYQVLHQYVKDGYTKKMDPAYFEFALNSLAKMDSVRFEEMASSYWNIYSDGEAYMAWMTVINRILTDSDRVSSMGKLSQHYKESYLHFINGSFLLKEIGKLIPSLLTNWLKVSDSRHTLTAAAAVVAWNEMFRGTVEASVVYKAENYLLELDQTSSGWEEAVVLSDEVLDWAKSHNLHVAKPLLWMIQEIKRKQSFRLLVSGTFESGKSTFINSIIGESVIGDENTSVVIIENDDASEIFEITETDVQKINRIEDIPSFRQQRSFHVKMPIEFLQKHHMSLIDTPSLNGKEACLPFVHSADGVLFVLNALTPFTKIEQEELLRMRQELPGLPIHFLLNKMDSAYENQEEARFVEEALDKIKHMEPEARIFTFSPLNESKEQLYDLSQFFSMHYKGKVMESGKTRQMLYYIRETISYLLNQRLKKENELVDSVKWNEEMMAKLNGAIHQMGDVESEKTRTFTRSFREFNEKIKVEILEKVPSLLKECSGIIKEDSHLGKIHVELNDEMNKRVESYLVNEVLPEYHRYFQEWIEMGAEEFNGVQSSLDEMCDSFNSLYDEELLRLECDFKVLDDWRRDGDRLTSGMPWEKMNLLTKFTTAQLLLKSAGKLLGVLPQNNTIIFNKYKQFVETADYYETAELVASRFLQQFELFDRSLERDIAIFFRNPLAILDEAVEKTRADIAANKAELENMRQNPEWYRDPLTLFELKLRQYEWLNQKGNKVTV